MKSLFFWRTVSAVWFLIAVTATLLLTDKIPKPAFLHLSGTAREPVKADDFGVFEGVNFAREFSERSHSFEPGTFKVSQLATAFLLGEKDRANRVAEVERLEEKIVRGQVSQRARLMTLVRLPGTQERYQADLNVELREGPVGKATTNEFEMRLTFVLEHTDRSTQNPWGFLIQDFKQEVLATNSTADTMGTAPAFYLRSGTAVLVRFPCSIENVELPKGTSVRVKLATFDISELQLTTDKTLATAETVRAICKDKVFTMQLLSDSSSDQPLMVLKTLTMANAREIPRPAAIAPKKRKKLGVEKSIEEQLGFVIEE